MGRRIVVVEQSTLLRRGLSVVLARIAWEVAGEAACFDDGVAAMRRERPDVVLVDPALAPRPFDLRPLVDIARAAGTRVVALGATAAADAIAVVLASGAIGYVLKAQPLDGLAEALERATRDECSLPPSIARELVDEYRAASLRNGSLPPPLALLSPRERAVFALLVEGASSARIAARLGIRLKTVESHRASVLRKLAVSSYVELVRLAERHALLDGC
jgi:DNA-binding NarL/FixJ family response regulator